MHLYKALRTTGNEHAGKSCCAGSKDAGGNFYSLARVSACQTAFLNIQALVSDVFQPFGRRIRAQMYRQDQESGFSKMSRAESALMEASKLQTQGLEHKH